MTRIKSLAYAGCIQTPIPRQTLRVAARAALEGDARARAGRAWRLLVGRSGAGAFERYAIAIGLSAAAAAVSFLPLRDEQSGFRVLLYVAAVAGAALRGGVGPGMSALAVCAVAYGLGADTSAIWLRQPDPLHRLVLFVGFAALTVWVAGALRDGFGHLSARRRRAEARADTQHIAAELGVRALAEGNLEALLADTVASVQRGLRCDTVTLFELRPDGGTLLLRDASGAGRDLAGRDFGPREAPLAFRALLAREPLAVDAVASDPALVSPALLEQGLVSSLMAPVVASGPAGRPFGVLGAHARARRAFTPDDAAFLQTAANVVGTAVVRLRSEERVRQSLATERFLADANRQLALSIDWQQTLSRVAKLALPFLGDWCLVVALEPDGRPRSVVAEALDPAAAAAARDLLASYPIDLAAEHGVGRILRTGEPELVPDVTPETFVGEQGAAAEARREVLRRLGLRSYLGAPMWGNRGIVGAIAFGVSGGNRRYAAEDLQLAEALAQRCGVALENARLYRAAQEATSARERVLEVVSHDLKAPLGALLMGAQMVERLAPPGGEGDALRRAAGTVRRAAQRMGRLINDLVDGASIEAGGLSLRVAPHDATAVVGEAVEGLREVAAERGLALAFEPTQAPTVACDRDRILQVLTNLLANAIQVTDDGGRVAVEVRAAGPEVVFAVSDTGPGISEEELPHLFQRWYRGRAVRYTGSGLGLSIAHAIVDAHGGRIWAESRQGQGTTFSFALPSEGKPQPSASVTG